MKLTRRFLALLLVLSMSLSMVTPAFASETETEPVVEEAAVVETEAVEVVETEAAETETEAPETEAPVVNEAVVETESVSETATGIVTVEEASQKAANTVFDADNTSAEAASLAWTLSEDNSEVTASVTVTANVTTFYVRVPYIGDLYIDGEKVGYIDTTMHRQQLSCDGSEKTFELRVVLEEPGKSINNPLCLTADMWDWSEDGLTGTMELTVAKNTTVYLSIPFTGTFNAGASDIEVYGSEDGGWPTALTANDAARTFTLTIKIAEPAVGSEENPIYPEWVWNDAGTEASFTVSIPAGETYYFYVVYSGMTMTVNGEEAGIVNGNGRMPELHTITNDGTEVADYTVKLVALVGTMDNPAELTDGIATAEIDAGSQGYFYTYTAPADGTAIFEISAADSEGNDLGWVYVINNLTTYQYGDTQWSDSDPVVNPAEIAVNEGDELQIMVNTYDPADMWNSPEGTVTVSASFEYPYGSEQNPVSDFYMGMGAINGEAAAGATVYYSIYGIGGMTMTIADAADLTVTVAGVDYTADENGVISAEMPAVMGRMPVSFSVTNTGAEAAQYAMEFAYALGSMSNPAQLVLGENAAELTAGSQGYFYTFTAPYAGTLTLNISVSEGLGWTYTVNNLTTYQYGDSQWSDSDPVVNPAEVAVSMGDEIQVIVNTYDPLSWDAPAGTVTVDAECVKGGLTEEEPILIYDASVPTRNANAAGETIYYAAYGIGNMIMTVTNAADLTVAFGEDQYPTDENGVITLSIPASANPRMPVTFSVTNKGEEVVDYSISFSYPVGHMENPEEVDVDIYGTETTETAAIEAGSQGYYYTYTATERGTLTVTFGASEGLGWSYVINNLTSYVYGDTQWSDSDPVVNPAVVPVNIGDQIQIIVNTYDPENPWSAPAGEISMTMAFDAAYGSASNPINEFYMGMGTISGTAPANTAVYYNVYGVGSMVLKIVNAENLFVTVGENYYYADDNGMISVSLPAAMGRQPVSFCVTNIASEEQAFDLNFEYPEGHMSNPAELTDDGATAVIEANADAYYYNYTATERGTLFVTVNGDSWMYQVYNLNSGVQNEFRYSSDEPLVNPDAIEVNVGDKIQILVNTHNPEDIWSTPAGEISVSLYIEPAVGSKSWPIYTECPEDGIISGTAPANTDMYYTISGIGGVGGTNLTIEDAADLEVVATYYDSDWNQQTVTGVADENGTVTLELPLYTELDSIELMIGNNGNEEVSYDMTFSFGIGHKFNPDELILGKTDTYLEAGSSYYYYNWTADENGYFTITMNGENWLYAVKSEDANWYDVPEISSDAGPASTTLYVNEGDQVQIKVNNYDPTSWSGAPAGEVSFTTSVIPAEYEIISGKKLTLTFTDPTTGKKVSGSKLNWNIASVYVYDPNGNPVAYEDASAYATLKNGTLTTKACGDQVHMVIKAALKTDETVSMTYYVDILPAATKLSIWAEGQPMVGTIDWDVNPSTIDPETEYLDLDAYCFPSNAKQDVTWKSSNAKVMTVDEEGVIRPVWDAKKGEYKTGTVTITATAKDGSGKKASFKVKISKLASFIEISRQDGEALVEIPTWWDYEWDEELQEYVQIVYESIKGTYAEAGSKLKLTATIDPNASDKTVNWECGSAYAKVSKGTVTIAKDAPQGQEIRVYAYDKEYRTGDCIIISVKNTAVTVDAGIHYDGQYVRYANDKDAYFDVSTITSAENLPTAELYGYAINADEVYTDITDWRISGSAAELKTVSYWSEWIDLDGDDICDVEVKHYDIENAPDGAYINTEATLSPVWDAKKNACKTGTVTITAVAADGKTKASFKVTMVNMVNTLEIKTKDGKNIADAEAETFWNPYIYDYETGEYGIWHEGKVAYATAGQALTLTAEVNQNAANKKIYWWADCLEYPDAVKMSNGKLTVSKDLPTETVVWVEAYSLYNNMYVMDAWIPVVVSPRATNVHLRTVTTDWDGVTHYNYVSNITKDWDVNTDDNWDGEPDTLQLSALVYPFDASQDVTWTVSNKNIATIDADGLLTFTGKKFGKLTVTATAADGSKMKTSFTLNVFRTVQNMELPEEMVVTANKSLKLASKLTFDPAPTVKNITWSMLMADLDENGNFQYHPWFGNLMTTEVPENVATLDAKGTLKVNKNLADYEILYVTATDTISGQSATTEITLCPKAMTGIVVKDMDGNVIKSGSTVTIKDGSMFGFTVEPKNSADKTYADAKGGWYNAFSFATSKPNVATYAVTQYGVYVIQTLEAGSSKITVKALDGSNKSFSFNVNFPNAPATAE